MESLFKSKVNIELSLCIVDETLCRGYFYLMDYVIIKISKWFNKLEFVRQYEMKSIQEKLDVLSKLAAKFNKEGIVWAVGGSLLLYFKGYVENFNDLDIMVADVDAIKMENILKSYGKMLPLKKENCDTKVRYETKHFREFIVNDVDVDMMGGLIIVSNGEVYDCDLKQSQIVEYVDVNGQKVPLHSVTLWRKYYALMGRDNKVEIIDHGLSD